MTISSARLSARVFICVFVRLFPGIYGSVFRLPAAFKAQTNMAERSSSFVSTLLSHS